jgi:hypothetical protein
MGERRLLLVSSREKEASRFRPQIFGSRLALSPMARSLSAGHGDVVGLVESLKAVPCESQDCIIVEADVLLQTSFSNELLGNMIQKTWSALTTQGRALFFLPSGSHRFFDFHKIVRALKKQKFKSLDWYTCEPSAEDPSRMVMFSGNRRWAINQVAPSLPGKPRSAWPFMRRAVKRGALQILGVYYPFYSFLVVAEKSLSCGAWHASSLVQKVAAIVRDSVCSRATFNIRLSAQRHRGIDFVFVHDSESPRLLAAAKSCHTDSPAFAAFERERDNLVLVSSALKGLTRPKISSPTVLHSDQGECKATFVTSAAEGRPVSDLVREYSRNRDFTGLRTLMDESLGFVVGLHQVLNEKLREKVPHFGHRYLENYLSICPVPGGPNGTDFPEATWVQHGDLSADNVFFNHKQTSWSIIDWEWLGSGYTPLFDLLTFLRSVGASHESSEGSDWRNEFLRSSIQTFFRRNPLSNLQKELLYGYCERMKVDSQRIFDYFMQFLIWRCNRYRLDGGADPNAITVWEKLVAYAAGHEHEFICR